jgi:hypothetical protein
MQSYNPNLAVTILVWAPSRSLTTTWEIIIIFSSSGYLDVSVHRVCFLLLQDTTLACGGLPHSDIYGLTDICSSP